MLRHAKSFGLSPEGDVARLLVRLIMVDCWWVGANVHWGRNKMESFILSRIEIILI